MIDTRADQVIDGVGFEIDDVDQAQAELDHRHLDHEGRGAPGRPCWPRTEDSSAVEADVLRASFGDARHRDPRLV